MSATVDPEVPEGLVCPDCHSKVSPVEGGAGLECAGCGRIYPVRDGILVMTVDGASSPTRKPGG